MKQSFMATGKHKVEATFGVRCDVTITNVHTNRSFSASLLFNDYNEAVDFVKDNDHDYVIGMLEKKYGTFH